MASPVETLAIRTSAREEMVNITDQVQRVITHLGVKSGLVCVYSPHTTAGITIQENADPDVCTDILGQLRKLVPRQSDFRHSEGNSDAHIKASLVGSSCMIPLHDGRLLLGTWQAIYFCEFDGSRSRRAIVKVLPA